MLNPQIATLWGSQFITTLGLMILVPIMPLYLAEEMSLSLNNATQWGAFAMAAPSIASLLSARYIGICSDRWGYRPVLMFSLVVFSVSMLLMAWASELWIFILGRLLQGLSGVSLCILTFTSALGKGKEGLTIGSIQSATAAGAVIGPVMGGWLNDHWQLQPLLYLTALVSLIVCLAIRSCTPDLKVKAVSNQQLVKPDLQGARRWLWAGLLSQAAAVALVICFGGFIQQQLSLINSASVAGLMHAMSWLACLIASPLWGRSNDAGHTRRNFLIAAACCSLCLLALPYCQSIYLIALFRIVQGACFAALIPSMQLVVQQQVSESQRGQALGISQSYLSLGQIVGPLLIMTATFWLTAIQLVWLCSLLFAAAFISIFQPTFQQSGRILRGSNANR